VLDALPARGGLDAGGLARQAGRSVADVLGALGALEVDGLVRRVDGVWRRVAAALSGTSG
jgi:DNA processing protein